MAFEQINFNWVKYIYNHFPGGYSVTSDGEPPFLVLAGAGSNPWSPAIAYPFRQCTYIGATQWESLQPNNIGHNPETSPEWWKATTHWKELDFLFFAIPGYVKSTGWNGSSYDIHINNPTDQVAWQYLAKDIGPNQCAFEGGFGGDGLSVLRQSPTSATGYSLVGVEDSGEGTIRFQVIRARNGVDAVIWEGWLPVGWMRFLVTGVNGARILIQRAVGQAHASETWTSAATPSSDVYETLMDFVDPDPITYAEGPYFGLRQPARPANLALPYHSIHETACGSFGLLTAETRPLAGGSRFVGSRFPLSDIQVRRR